MRKLNSLEHILEDSEVFYSSYIVLLKFIPKETIYKYFSMIQFLLVDNDGTHSFCCLVVYKHKKGI